MEPRVTFITLGVADLPRATRFYRDALGFPLSAASQEGISFFQLGPMVLGLFGRKDLAEDAHVANDGAGFDGIALAQNVREKGDVDRVINEAVAAGATLRKAAEDAAWGGRSGYFADPDGHLWEVAWNPFFPLDAQGQIALPE